MGFLAEWQQDPSWSPNNALGKITIFTFLNFCHARPISQSIFKVTVFRLTSAVTPISYNYFRQNHTHVDLKPIIEESL